MPSWLSWLNPKQWGVSFLKRIAVYEVQKEGDALEEKVKAAVAASGPDAVAKVIDDSARLLLTVINSRGPSWSWLQQIRIRVAQEVTDHADALKLQLSKEVLAAGPDAVARVFDATQALLIARINAL